jgi:hypothetical protein
MSGPSWLCATRPQSDQGDPAVAARTADTDAFSRTGGMAAAEALPTVADAVRAHPFYNPGLSNPQQRPRVPAAGTSDMQTLQISPGWSSQIAAIRDRHTEDTNLIRVGNTFYRMCSGNASHFHVQLQAAGSPALQLALDARDFRVLSIDGHAPDPHAGGSPEAPPGISLGEAVHSLACEAPPPEQARPMRTLVAFCVAESIRSDHLAAALEHSLCMPAPAQAGAGGLTLREWWTLAPRWGAASDAIYAILSPQARRILEQPRSRLTPQQGHYSEYVDAARLPAHLQRCAQVTKVLRHPDLAAAPAT